MTLVIFLIYFVGAILCETTADSDTDTSITRTTTDNVADIHAELNKEAQRYPSLDNLYHLGFQAGVDAAGKRLVPKIGNLRKDLVSIRTNFFESGINNLGKMDKKYDIFKSIALRTAVATFECMKFELYELLWNTGGPTGADFVIDYIPDYLLENSKKDYISHHKTWKTILESSVHQGAIRFKNYLTKKIGVEKNGKTELNTELASRDIAFAIVMLQNSKHGQEAKELGMDFFKTAQDVVVAIALTKCIEDPDIITIVKMFELVTRGKEED